MFKTPSDTIDRSKKRMNVKGFTESDHGRKRPPRPPPKGKNIQDMGDLRKRAATQNTPVGGGG